MTGSKVVPVAEKQAWIDKLWYEEQSRRQKAEAKVSELEASALNGYEDGWYALRAERDDLKSKVEAMRGLGDRNE